ncbi:bifunctional diaminohydroxyphosphoribosylaminopyrimidine deaminase/5-amino-6-(5-phosphoribosylamino)uracil reductase RibD [Terrilactibacillus tamarindi]|nr:bifunctional diaminohydroxyphosphoribosylaminopyrimidine deaminase/5-amino-6-(5-phosphoribosylamino)uracil reductase RibD [Terrilactibacillus tamarindi]
MNDQDYMKLAIDLAKATVGQTSPNPAVGAVVVHHGEIVGMGAHLKAGEAHAEVQALRMAGERARGATIYVTLEPCSHFGKTPPCADLIIEKELKRVVVASNDPNPLVSGKGLERIRQAGITVETGILKEQADQLNKFFFHYMKKKVPFVTLKTASSVDGKTATVTGESQWITGEESRQDVHQLRHQHDSILVGVNTVITDNPSLTTRLPHGGKNPIRIILDTYLRTPEESQVIKDQAAPTWIMTGSQIDQEKKRRLMKQGHVTIYELPVDKIKIKDVLHLLGEKLVTSLLVEGGATIHESFVKEGCFDEIIMYFAPKIIGGEKAPSIFGGIGISKLSQAIHMNIESIDRIGRDVKIIARPERR